MDLIRRNTDYALRLMVNLAGQYGKGIISARQLSKEEDVSYQLTCKLLQKLCVAGLIRSRMGPTGGYYLARKPSKITLGNTMEVIQGTFSVNRCIIEPESCLRQSGCSISRELKGLQKQIESFLHEVTLDKLLKEGNPEEKIL